MREFICANCGRKAIDNTPTGVQKFCCRGCRESYYYREKKQSDSTRPVCQYNDGVLCEKQKCENCGWNPEVEKARKEKLNGQSS